MKGTDMLIENLVKVLLKSLNLNPDETIKTVVNYAELIKGKVLELDKRLSFIEASNSRIETKLNLLLEKLGVDNTSLISEVQFIESEKSCQQQT